MLRLLRLAPWRRAPLRILRWPSLLFGVGVAAFVLGLSIGSRPMFVSSAASGALAADIEDGCRFAVGLRIERDVLVGGDRAQRGAAALTESTRAVHDAVDERALGVEAVDTLIGDTMRVVPPEARTGIDRVQLMARSGFEDHIDVVERGPAGGVWLPDTVSESLGLRAGDDIHLSSGGGRTPTVVSGVFRDLNRGRDSHWCSVENRWIDEFRGRQPPPLVLLERDDLVAVLAEIGTGRAHAWWELAPAQTSWTLEEAERAVSSLRAVGDSSNNPATELGGLLGRGRSPIDQIGSVDHARRTATAIESAAGPVSMGTAGVAVLVLLTAGRSWLDRRRQEVTVLALRGAGPFALALKAILEICLPIVVGAGAGVLAAWALARGVGPSDLIAPSALRTGAAQAAGVCLIALVVVAVAVGAAVHRVGTATGGARSRPTMLWWEPAVLALAAAALYEVRSQEVREEDTVDALLLAFPVLLITGGAGLVARVAMSPRVGGWLAEHLPTAGWLAARRLIASRLRAAAIVTGTSVAIGIVCFASSISASLEATTTAKVLLGPGSEQVIRLRGGTEVPAGVGDDGASTVVVRTSELGVERRGHTTSDVLGVDPATFADGAFWDGSFASRDLGDLLDELAAPVAEGAPVPVIAVGEGLPELFALTLDTTSGATEIDVQVAGRADAFPGLGFRQRRPLVVIDGDHLREREVEAAEEVWVGDGSRTVEQRLVDAGAPPVFVTRPAAGAVESRLRTHLWAVDYLAIVGPAAGFVTLAGLALYLSATSTQRQVGGAMARRLGVGRATRVIATVAEVAGMTLIGWATGGVLSFVAARIVFSDLDPLPTTAPDAIFRYPGATVLATAAVALVAALLATAVVEGPSRRASLPELLRDAG